MQTVEWWYDDSLFHGEQNTLALALLRVREGGKAVVRVFDEVHEFPSVQQAQEWLREDEYNPVSDLQEVYGFELIMPSFTPDE